MTQEDKLPDTLTPSGPITSSDINDTLPPIWGRLIRRTVFIQSIELRNGSYVFGRKETCDIFMNSEKMKHNLLKHISKEHFIISRDYTLVPYIKDNSKNGTYLNGALIGKDKSVALRDGDLIAVGSKFHEIYQFKDESTTNVSEHFDNKYKMTRLLGKGAFGEVYLAIAKGTCSRYAVKRIEICAKDKLKIENEIKILETLDHPNVISMVEAIYCPRGFVYIILDYMEGGDLQSRVLKHRHLKEFNSKIFIYQIVLAVKYLHSCGITHRDLKPENVLIATKDDYALIKVTDFGMSKIVNQSSLLHSLCGTPLYVAPEILTPNGRTVSYTSLVDVWSLGCIIYFTLWGRTPFQNNEEEYDDEDSLPYLFNKIRRGQFEIPSQDLSPDLCEESNQISEDAIKLILSMLVVDPKNRIQVNDILKHEWFKDEKLFRKITKLYD